MPWPVTIFADECAADYAAQAAFVREAGLDGLDLRNANGRNVADLTAADVGEVLREGVTVRAVGSPVNKVPLDPVYFDAEMDKLERSVAVARMVGARHVRIFSPEPQGAEDDEQTWAAVQAWLEPMVKLAGEAGVVLLHENDARFYGYCPDQSRRLMERFSGPHLRMAFDFANTVLTGHRPWDHWFPWCLPYLDTLHIKDAVEATQTVVPAGEGEGQIEQTLRWLKDQGWQGTLTLEPHLARAGRMSGFSGPELCRTAVDALRAILGRI
ncbi:MAG: sugar phosphate isomerase/epimerase [Fimbriimonadaceae bacterium]|nr:sugar phosphate isomerase/epimerase [Fimbriimonadaceae bacterium]